MALSLDFRDISHRVGDNSLDNEAPYIREHASADGFASEAERKTARRRSERATQSSATADPQEATVVDEAEPGPAPPDDDATTAETPTPRKKRTRPQPIRSTHEPGSDATIAAELALLRAAQQAIAGGNPARALEKIVSTPRPSPAR